MLHLLLRCCCWKIYTSLESDVKSWHLLPCSNPNPNRFASVLLLFKSKAAAARYWVSGTNTGSGWHWQSNSKRCTRSCSGLKTFRIRLESALKKYIGTHLVRQAQDASSRGVTVPPLCPTPIWQAHVISKENSCFYLLSCLDIEICLPKSALGTSSDSGRWHLTGDILVYLMNRAIMCLFFYYLTNEMTWSLNFYKCSTTEITLQTCEMYYW